MLYTVIFACYQAMSLPVEKNNLLSFQEQEESQPFLTHIPLPPSRNLAQIDMEDPSEERILPYSSVNPGEILGSFTYLKYLRGYPNFVISKDGKTLFAFHDFILSIFDISNPHKEQKKSQFDTFYQLNKTVYLFEASLLLSSDEQTLFILSCSSILFLDISNQTSPSLIYMERFTPNTPDGCSSSLASSADGQILYAATEQNISIIDVSAPKTPVFLSNRTSNFTGKIDLSKDCQTIAIGSVNKFEIYNVSDPKNPLPISSINLNGRPISISFSHDENQIMLGITKPGSSLATNLLYLRIYNIKSSTLISSLQLVEDENWEKYSLWFHESKAFAFFSTRYDFRMISLTDFQQTNLFHTPLGINVQGFASSWRNNLHVVTYYGLVKIVSFNIDIAPKSFANFKPNALKVLDERDFNRKFVLALSPDEKRLFLVKSPDRKGQLISYNITNNFALEKLSTVEFLDGDEDLFSPNTDWNIIAQKNLVAVQYRALDLSGSGVLIFNPTNKSILANIGGFTRKTYVLDDAVLTPDEQSLIYISQSINHTEVLDIMTFDGQQFSPSLQNFRVSYDNCSNAIPLLDVNKASTLVFYVDCYLFIYNIRDPTSPTLESSYSLDFERIYSFILSKDEKTVYFFGYHEDDQKGYRKLEIIDVSDIRSPKSLGSMIIHESKAATYSLELSSDEKTLYVGFFDGNLMIDVRVPSQPKIFGYTYFLNEMHAVELAPTKNLFYTAAESGVTVYNATSQYILYMKNSDFKIGGSYPITLSALKLNKNFKFDFLAQEQKFHKVSLFEIDGPKALPSWITFDKERSLLKIEPNSAFTEGTYKISATLSTQTQSSAFIGLDSINNDTDAQNLMLNLLYSGYIDNQAYVSGDLDLTRELRIDLNYKAIEKEIRAILSQSYIQAICEISVTSSLNLSQTKPLKISSLSKGTLSVTLHFNETEEKSCYFLTKTYPYVKSTIFNKRSLLLEGSLENINEALKQVIIDLQDLDYCHGFIKISDGINPALSNSIEFLSNYFINNTKPVYNDKALALEKQMANQSLFYTGSYSVVEFDPKTFTDENNLPLEYSLQMPDSHQESPTWISLRGLNLMGTPPEAYSPRSYEFVLVAKNEYKNVTVPLTLEIHISFKYGVRLVGAYMGYLFTLVGLILTVNKVYNIIAQKYYRYPRSFRLAAHDEVNDHKIFPISFVKNEIAESKKLLKQLRTYVRQKDKTSLVEYFVNQELQTLDKQKIIMTLGEIQQEKNQYYKQADNVSKGVIRQFVINMIILEQLNTKKEAQTKKIFDQIKNNWMDLVLVAPVSAQQFTVTPEKLNKILSDISGTSKEENLNESKLTNESMLLSKEKNKTNMDLLKNAIIARAFNFQNLDIETINVDVISHKKRKGKSCWIMLRRLLLKDLQEFAFLNKREIGYGMKYKIDHNTLHFVGKLTCDLKDDIIVVHLKNKRGRILREIWITGENQYYALEKSDLENISEAL